MGADNYKVWRDKAGCCTLCQKQPRYDDGELMITWFSKKPFVPFECIVRSETSLYSASDDEQDKIFSDPNNGIWVCWTCKKTIQKVQSDVYNLEHPERLPIQSLWEQVRAKMVERSSECSICKLPLTAANVHTFELDHDGDVKHDAICEMINKQLPIEEIFEEMKECRDICVECHKRVTKRNAGSTSVKRETEFRESGFAAYFDENGVLQRYPAKAKPKAASPPSPTV